MSPDELRKVDQIVANAESLWRCLLWSYLMNVVLLVGLVVEVHGG